MHLERSSATLDSLSDLRALSRSLCPHFQSNCIKSNIRSHISNHKITNTIPNIASFIIIHHQISSSSPNIINIRKQTFKYTNSLVILRIHISDPHLCVHIWKQCLKSCRCVMESLKITVKEVGKSILGGAVPKCYFWRSTIVIE